MALAKLSPHCILKPLFLMAGPCDIAAFLNILNDVGCY